MQGDGALVRRRPSRPDGESGSARRGLVERGGSKATSHGAQEVQGSPMVARLRPRRSREHLSCFFARARAKEGACPLRRTASPWPPSGSSRRLRSPRAIRRTRRRPPRPQARRAPHARTCSPTRTTSTSLASSRKTRAPPAPLEATAPPMTRATGSRSCSRTRGPRRGRLSPTTWRSASRRSRS